MVVIGQKREHEENLDGAVLLTTCRGRLLPDVRMVLLRPLGHKWGSALMDIKYGRGEFEQCPIVDAFQPRNSRRSDEVFEHTKWYNCCDVDNKQCRPDSCASVIARTLKLR